MSALEKPQLRGLHQSQIKRNLVGMLVVSVTGAMLLKTFMADRRKKRYVEFYKTYDPEKQLKKMNESGFMQSYLPPYKK